ncbi:unnamed protein product [Amaranthus hypochondriacus]
MALLLFLALFLSFTNYSSATYCLCKGGAQDPTAYQRVIDYACGAGADCRAIQSNGPCYVANNPKAICDYAVNSYFQNKGQVTGSCVFSGAAMTSDQPPTTVPTGCTFPTSGSPVTPGTSTGTGIPSSTPGSITGTPGSTTGIFSPTGLAPSGDFGLNPSNSPSTLHFKNTFLITLVLFSGVLALRA